MNHENQFKEAQLFYRLVNNRKMLCETWDKNRFRKKLHTFTVAVSWLKENGNRLWLPIVYLIVFTQNWRVDLDSIESNRNEFHPIRFGAHSLSAYMLTGAGNSWINKLNKRLLLAFVLQPFFRISRLYVSLLVFVHSIR